MSLVAPFWGYGVYIQVSLLPIGDSMKQWRLYGQRVWSTVEFEERNGDISVTAVIDTDDFTSVLAGSADDWTEINVEISHPHPAARATIPTHGRKRDFK